MGRETVADDLVGHVGGCTVASALRRGVLSSSPASSPPFLPFLPVPSFPFASFPFFFPPLAFYLSSLFCVLRLRYDSGVFTLRSYFLFARAEHTSAPTSLPCLPPPTTLPPQGMKTTFKRPRARRRRSLQAGRTRRRFPTTIREVYDRKGCRRLGSGEMRRVATRSGGRRRRKHRRPDRREEKGVMREAGAD